MCGKSRTHCLVACVSPVITYLIDSRGLGFCLQVVPKVGYDFKFWDLGLETTCKALAMTITLITLIESFLSSKEEAPPW